MASGIKLDTKNEKIVRGLMKLPENKKCINCNRMAPQYVCTNFWTFICANCSGIHREFTHRVKSVSMAKFTSQEVAALQDGGNKRAKDFFFNEWVQLPDSNNAEKLRTFIKHVYVDRKFTGDKRVDRAPKGDMGDEQRKDAASCGNSRSPPYDSALPLPHSDRSSPGRNQDSKGNQNSRSEGYSASDEKLQNHCRKQHAISSPIADILGDNTLSLQVAEPPKSNGGKIAEIPTPAQRTLSLDSIGSTTGVDPTESKSVPIIAPPPAEVVCASIAAPAKVKCMPITVPSEVKSESLDGLIDFNEDFDPSAATKQHLFAADAPQTTISQVDGGNWAVFDSVSDQSITQKKNSSPIGSDVSQLFIPENTSTFNNAPTLPNVLGVDPRPKTSDQFLASQENMSTLFASGVDHSSDVAPPIQPYVSSLSSASIEQNSQILEVKPSDRRELPVDLFSMNYAMIPGSIQGWQEQHPYGMGLSMQYPIPTPSFPCPSNMTNPFDVSNQQNVVHPSTFPSMVPLQATLPNPVDTLNLLRSSTFEDESHWMPQQQLPNSITTIARGYSSQVPNNMGQQASSDLFSMGNQAQAVGEIGQQSIDPSGTPGMNENLNNSYPQPDISSSFTPPSGNPFG